MSTRQILVSVWQTQSIRVNDLLSISNKFDIETVIEIFRELTLPDKNERITVNEAEEKLEESLFLRVGRRNLARH